MATEQRQTPTIRERERERERIAKRKLWILGFIITAELYSEPNYYWNTLKFTDLMPC